MATVTVMATSMTVVENEGAHLTQEVVLNGTTRAATSESSFDVACPRLCRNAEGVTAMASTKAG